MSAHDSSKYYWIKIKTGFLTSKEVDYIMRQKGGSDYVVLYQSLCLLAINSDGLLADRIGELLVPYDENKIFGLTKGWFSIDTIRVGLALFSQLNLIFKNENGILKLNNFSEMVGSETYAAERMRIARTEKKLIPTSQKSEQCSPNVRQENRDIEIREVDGKSLENKSEEKINNETNIICFDKKEEALKEDSGHATDSTLPF